MPVNVLLSHSDLDGVGCALIARLTGFQIIRCCTYNGPLTMQNVLKSVMKQTHDVGSLFLTDIGISDEMWNEMKEDIPVNLPVTLIDHHDTSVAATSYKNRITCLIDLDKCATRIFYESFLERFPALAKYDYTVRAIDAFDTWNFERSPAALDLQRAFDFCISRGPVRSISFENKLSQFINCLWSDPVRNADKYPSWMRTFIEQYHRRLDGTINDAINGLYADGNVCVIDVESADNVPTFELSWYVDENMPEVTDTIYVIKKKNSVSISLRSRREGVDLSKIAEEYGGGGHAQAAAFQCDYGEHLEIVDDLKERLKVDKNKQ